MAYSLFSINNLANDLASRIPPIDYHLLYNNGKDPRICNWLDRGSNLFTWSQWKAAGLDAHSVVADPMFVNASAGDYPVKDGSPALTLGFKNFPMTGFGVTTGPEGGAGSRLTSDSTCAGWWRVEQLYRSFVQSHHRLSGTVPTRLQLKGVLHAPRKRSRSRERTTFFRQGLRSCLA